MNNLKPDEKDNVNTITETIKLPNVKEWNDTGKTNWTRKCPKCNKEISYKRSDGLLRAKKKNSLCHICTMESKRIYKIDSKILERLCPKCNTIITYTTRPHYVNAFNKNSLCSKCGITKPRGPLNENHKRKLREARLIKLIQLGVVGNYNPNACKYFNKLNQEKNWNLQHAKNGGELMVIGYRLDAYDKNRNVVVEYDEKHHRYQKQKDLIRQQNIINHLNCDFYRYDEKSNLLSQVHSSNAAKFQSIRN